MLQIVIILIIIINSIYADVASTEYTIVRKDPVQISTNDNNKIPYINGMKTLYGGTIRTYEGKSTDVTSPILNKDTGERVIIGKLAQMNTDDIKEVLSAAKAAWNGGSGTWPQMSVAQRITALENVVKGLKERRQEIIDILMWEICKSTDDATAEFDRTMKFIDATIDAFKTMDAEDGDWRSVGGILSRVRRAAIGIMLCLGPFNYPFNETYATLIPALLSGNVVIMKIPSTGGLAHVLTMEVYAKYLPPGVVNFFSGSGRETMGPLMSTGDIDVLAFIGGSNAADAVIKAHPHPHRLKVFLQLEGKNLGIVLPDADIDTAVQQVTIGSTNFNGQRCTAIKLIMLHSSIADAFIDKFIASVAKLEYGLPWKEGGVQITPLPEPKKPQYLQELIQDAIKKGAKVINSNEGGGNLHGNLMRPAIVYPVTDAMRVWHEEQFGPVIPIAVYDDLEEIYSYLRTTPYGQQAAIFTEKSHSAAPIIDKLSTVVGRININTQCGRSPDVLPFSARRSSAMGTMSVTEAIREFSTETVVAAKHNDKNELILKEFETNSVFLSTLDNSKANKNEL